MLRTHTCGELRIDHLNQTVTLSGWVQGVRDKGSLLWIDLRDRYGITQITIETEHAAKELIDVARTLGREFVISVTGKVVERYSKTYKIATGEIEIQPTALVLLNAAITPPFTIEDETDGGDELRMKYRYLDLRRNPVRKNLELRHRLAIETRNFLDKLNFLEVETPVLIKSTPEGARDFVVPSRMNQGEFYALPQSPQTFKQLLMVGGFDRYYQIVKCFRDEDLRADRQPEFTQIDCEMAFVEQEDILQTFEGLVSHLFKTVKGIEIPALTRMTYAHAMQYYGNDKPDIRFDMKLVELKNNFTKNRNIRIRISNEISHNELIYSIKIEGKKYIQQIKEIVQNSKDTFAEFATIEYSNGEHGQLYGNMNNFNEVVLNDFMKYKKDGKVRVRRNLFIFLKPKADQFYEVKKLRDKIQSLINSRLLWRSDQNEPFKLFNEAQLIVGIAVKGCAEYTRKQLDELTEFVKRPQIGANGLVYVRYGNDGVIKSSVDKFYSSEELTKWAKAMHAKPGDLLLILAGEKNKTRKAMSELRLEMGTRLGLRDKNTFACHWVIDFPLLEWNEESARFHAMHHPFTSPKPEDIELLETNPGAVRANAYDMVINGVEVGGGSIRIFNKALQAKMFGLLGFKKEEAQEQFGFLMNAFEFGAPPHGGIAFGFDRLCSLFGGAEVIRDFIAFPKNNSGRDVMIDSPSIIAQAQLNELGIALKK